MIDPVATRQYVYQKLLAHGVPPRLDEIALHFGTSVDEARERIATLKIGKTVLPHPETGEIWMAGPFSAFPTAYRVHGRNVSWWANCAWDMLGIPMITADEVRIETRCTDCGDAINLSASPSAPPDTEGVVHFLVPARNWYDDVGFT